MRDRLLVSPLVAGDPLRVGSDVTSTRGLLSALGLEASAVALDLVPGVVLVVAPAPPAAPLSLHWVSLPRALALWPAGSPASTAVVVAAPASASAEVVAVSARLRSCLADPARLAGARQATSRAELVGILRAADADGEAVLDVQELLVLLGSGPAGLTAAEATRRLAACGPNELERVGQRPLFLRLLTQFASFFAVLLWVGAALAFLAALPELGYAVVAVIMVNGVFSFWQEYRAERAVEALQRLLPPRVVVRRDGTEDWVNVSELVPGDVVLLEEGQQVPADGQLFEADGLRIDQSALTGEAQPVFKLPARGNERAGVPRLERHELVFAGTGVVAGQGVAVVTATAMTTEIGRMARLTQSVPATPSPLQREMVRVTRVVTVLAVGFGAGFFTLGVTTGALSVSDGLMFALGVIVANVPEGLLPTLTLALALGVQRLARAGAVVKRLSAVEALGATTVICTDKTGTLTRGVMAVRFACLGGRTVPMEPGPVPTPADLRELLEAAVLASQATREHGDPTEVALVRAAERAGIDTDEVRRRHPLQTAYPFDSFRKRMTLVRERGDASIAFVKGAPRETLALCDTIRDGTGVRGIAEDDRQAVMAEHDRLAGGGLRLIGVAVRGALAEPATAPASAVEHGLTFLGVLALWDPPRPEVAAAIATCQAAGIRVVMVTGDYGLTARAIARQIGLPVSKMVTGEEVERLDPHGLCILASEPGVLFARTSPAHKLAIVGALRAGGDVVAVTGDGVNDAPALKASDIGVAMGRRGSDVAREAAEIVLTDDNFATIVAAVREGRTIYANMGKFVTYIFASNVPELVPFLAFVFLHIPLPLTIMQILAVDLGTDLVPALALGRERPEPDVMARPPRRAGDRLLGRGRLLRAYAFLGVAEAMLAMLAFFWTYWLAGWRPGLPMAAEGDLYRRATTMTLAGIVAGQVGNVFACRTDRESVFRIGLLGNRMVLVGIAVEIAALVALITIAPLRAVFGLAPLAPSEWGPLCIFPVIVLMLDEGRKRLTRPSEAPGAAPRAPAPAARRASPGAGAAGDAAPPRSG